MRLKSMYTSIFALCVGLAASSNEYVGHCWGSKTCSAADGQELPVRESLPVPDTQKPADPRPSTEPLGKPLDDSPAAASVKAGDDKPEFSLFGVALFT